MPRPKGSRNKRVKFSKPLGEHIALEMEKGRTLTEICKDEGMPSLRAVHKWKYDFPEFAQRYEEAEVNRLNLRIDLLHDLADLPPPNPNDAPKDLTPAEKKQWVNMVMHQRRNKMDSIKFEAAKMMPKKYGEDRMDVVQTGDTYNIVNYSVPSEQIAENVEMEQKQDEETHEVKFIPMETE